MKEFSLEDLRHLDAADGWLGLGAYDEAEAHFEHALAVHEALRSPLLLARTHLGWGQMLVVRARREDREPARAHIRAAVDLAERYDCRLVAAQATELLEQS